MPYKRNYKKKKPYRKKRYKKRTNYKVSTINKTNPFPKQFMTKLRYETSVDIDPPLGSSASHLFRANSVFDPDFTGVGNQPRYFDQIMPLYDHFTVIGAKITVKVANPHTVPYVVGVQLNGNGLGPGNLNDLIEQRNSTYKWIGHAYANSAINQITKTFSVKKFLGVSKPLSESDLRGTISANPTEQAYFAVTAGSHDPAVNAPAIPLRVIIDYIVVFTEPRAVGSS